MRRQEPGEPLQKTEPGRRPHRHKAEPKAGARPADAALLQAAPSEGPGSARSCRLDKGASPALLTGTRACSWRQRAPQSRDTCPEYRAGTPGRSSAGLAATQHRQRPRPWLQVGPGAHATTKRLRSVLKKQGRGRTVSPPGRFMGTALWPQQSSSFPPGTSKPHCSVSKESLTHPLTRTN